MIKTWCFAFTLFVAFIGPLKVVYAESTLAFEGAAGFGKYTRGGNDGKVLVVTTLEDNAAHPKEGSLRWAVKQKYPRLIVFAVSGIIQLQDTLEIKHPNITIAGQTSPGGIALAGESTSIETDQVIIRHLRFRPGHFLKEGDALSARNHSDIIIDHCSMSWANDEVGSFYNNTRFTLQNSILSESLNNAGHHKGSHGYGGIWGGRKASFLQNVLVSHVSRNPRINGWRLKSPYPQSEEFIDIRNNVIANWRDASGYGGEAGKANLVGNVYLPGPATSSPRFFEFWGDDRPIAQLFIAENLMKGDEMMTADNRLGIKVKNQKKHPKQAADIESRSLSNKPFMGATIDALGDVVLNTEQVWHKLIIQRDAGANAQRLRRGNDSVDTRIFDQVANNQFQVGNKGIIDSELDVMRWDTYLKELTAYDNNAIEQPDEASYRSML
ncbi:pectate lyase family protein [Alteromonas confluentis]|uniref:Pectate lyase C n=1 Tax=Alteromonas confluentis TaxID=1656094 RepID=A0A1E7ZDM3_9ALTE|nr:pectate lyase C [Alteromonas confluentis]OFC71609.1 pectate lyase C [Alteromonas confluentis]